MKKSTITIALSTALACAVLQSRPAAAQLKSQTVDYKQADTALEGYLAYDGNVTGKRPGILLVHRRDGMSDFGIFRISSPKATFSATVRCGNSA